MSLPCPESLPQSPGRPPAASARGAPAGALTGTERPAGHPRGQVPEGGSRGGPGVPRSWAGPLPGAGGVRPCPPPPRPRHAQFQRTPMLWPWAPRGVWVPSVQLSGGCGLGCPGQNLVSRPPSLVCTFSELYPGSFPNRKKNPQPQNPGCLPGRPGAWSCCPWIRGEGHGHGFLTGAPVPTTGKPRPGVQTGRVQTPADRLSQRHGGALWTSSHCPSVCPCLGSVRGEGDHAFRL